MLRTAREFLEDFAALAYPAVCAACNKGLMKNENCICTHCLFHLPKTNHHLDNENPVHKLFTGRVNIEFAAAFYLFTKRSKVQNLLHRLKYKGQTDVGIITGQLFGYDLKRSAHFKNIDLIVPVPLHKKKLKRRGYNQSEFFAQGISGGMGSEISNNLIRTKDTSTQTRKSRYKRWENVSELFSVPQPQLFENKHILLVDDVVTTGATLEACATEILKSQGSKVSIATLAYANSVF